MPNVKMGADISSFKSGIAAAKSEVKTLDQQMKMLDATMKAEGKSEQTLNMQTQTLNSRLAAQKNIAQQAEQALRAMSDNGVKPTSEAYQKMSRELLAAQTGMMETQAALNDLGDGAVQAAGGVEKLETGLNGISKKISLDQVITGIGKITNGLENAARKAVSLGQSLWDNIMDSAKWADDSATMAMMYGIDLDKFLRMQKLVINGQDTAVESVLKTQDKLRKGVGDSATATMDALRELNLLERITGKTGEISETVTLSDIDLFWAAGQALMNLSDSYDKEAKAQALFGKSWKELVPLFTEFKNQAELDKALKGVNVESESTVTNLATLNDKVGELKGNFDTLSREIMAQFAPGLISLSNSLNELLTSVLEYLKSEDGKKMLDSMAKSFESLFDGLKDVSVDDVVTKFKDAFDKIVGGFKWVSENSGTLLTALEGIGAFWAGLKVSEGVLTLLKVINGLKDLLGIGGGAAAGGGFGTTVGNALTGAVGKAAGVLGNATLMNNVPAIADWFVHNTSLGQEWFLGTREKGSTWKDIQENASTFADDWKNNALIKPIIDGYINAINFWNEFYTNAGKTAQTAGKYIQIAGEDTHGDDWTIEDALREATGGTVPVEITPEAPEDSAAKLAEQIGTVTVYVEPILGDLVNNTEKRRNSHIPGHANGLQFVPYDGYLAMLHKGEQVVPARQVASRNFTSNLYFENVNVNNGQDAEGLAARITAQQRREMSGYGSM